MKADFQKFRHPKDSNIPNYQEVFKEKVSVMEQFEREIGTDPGMVKMEYKQIAVELYALVDGEKNLTTE